MRDLVSCFSENAVGVSVSQASCSSYSSNASCIVSQNLVPSVRLEVTSIYKTILSTQKALSITVTWSKTNLGHSLSIGFGDEPDSSSTFKLITNNSRFSRKKKASKTMDLLNSQIEIFYDLSQAKYQSGPEPSSDFYIVVLVDSEIALTLGDFQDETLLKKLEVQTHICKFTVVSRKEQWHGSTLYATKAQFSDTGNVHDVSIKCSGENEGFKYPVLTVSVDKKMVMRVKRLHWNFRGNQTIFIDGLSVDLMWDVHDWFFNPTASTGIAVFMFRTRSGLDSRLWLEEKLVQKDQDRFQFSLLIYASKSS